MDFAVSRAKLVEDLSREIKDKKVLAVMSHLPRELFMPPGSRHLAYDDRPLPIGFGQTISQPLIIAMMTEALLLTGLEKVLEIGTGSGYQTAILAELSRRVVSTERIPQLAETAEHLLEELGYTNIEVHPAGETLGWPESAPYDAIMVTAGAPEVPPSLLEQLSPQGKMVIPVGSRHLQQLCRITRQAGRSRTENLGGCHFVSLIGQEAWEDNGRI